MVAHSPKLLGIARIILSNKLRLIIAAIMILMSLGVWSEWWSRYLPRPSDDNIRASRHRSTRPLRHPETRQVADIISKFKDWEAITDSAASDKAAEELKGLVTAANSGSIVRSLPSNLLETPVGLMALELWADRDRVAVLDWLSREQAPTRFQIATALRGWIARDREDVHGYVAQLSKGLWKEKVLAEAATSAVGNEEPLDAMLLARQLDPGETRTQLLSEAMLVWGKVDPDAASEWIDQVGDAVLRNRLIGMRAIGFAMAEPQAASEWLTLSLPPGEELNQYMGDVVSAWVGESSPVEAAAWVAALPVGEMRDACVRKLVKRWIEFDPHAVNNWTKSLPPGPLRSQAESYSNTSGSEQASGF